MPGKVRRAQDGFSLIEVVVALAIVALTLGTVLQLLGTTLGSVDRAGNYLKALSVAQSRLSEAATLSRLQTGISQGSQDGIDWRLSVEPVAGPQPTPKTAVYHVIILATYRGSTVELETLQIALASNP